MDVCIIACSAIIQTSMPLYTDIIWFIREMKLTKQCKITL